MQNYFWASRKLGCGVCKGGRLWIRGASSCPSRMGRPDEELESARLVVGEENVLYVRVIRFRGEGG